MQLGDDSEAWVDSEVAYECLSSVPIVQEYAEALVASLRGYLELQSTLDYLAAPPSGWLFPAVDIIDILSQIQAKVTNYEYSSEYDLQVDLHTMALLGMDGHFVAKGPLLRALTFSRLPSQETLVSLSEDGVQIPSVYLLGDRYYQGDHGELKLRNNGAYSAITKINGLDVQEYLQVESLTAQSQDPDALYNNLMYPFQLFGNPEFYPGPYTNFTFENGSTKSFKNYAGWGQNDLSGIVDGTGMYEQFFQAVDPSEDDSGASAARTTRKVKRETLGSLHFVDTAGVIGGFWGDGLPDDVAVIEIASFLPSGRGGSDVDFQETLQNILIAAKEEYKEKLIIDLRQNGGGSIHLCLDTMVQLFPDTPPDTKSSLRASGLQKALVEYYSEQTRMAEDKDPNTNADQEEVEADYWNSPWAYQAVMSPKARNFDSVDHYYGPYREGPGYFTSYFQENYTNNEYSLIDHSNMNITQAVPGEQWPFSPENIVILTDGYCASSCTIFVEHLKNKFGVMSIVVGGRPQTGPMQTIGGVRGSRVFEHSILGMLVEAYANQTTAHPESADPQFEYWDSVPADRFGEGLSVNGYNAYRVGEPHNIPLHFAYEAADCRIWYTPEMIEDPNVIWSRVAELAFEYRVGNVIESRYCVEGSTKHPTSISGGVRQGDLGPQTPPESAFPQYTGWIVNGTKVTQENLGRAHGDGPGAITDDDNIGDDRSGTTTVVDPAALQDFKGLCSGSITEEQWLLKLMCLNVQ